MKCESVFNIQVSENEMMHSDLYSEENMNDCMGDHIIVTRSHHPEHSSNQFRYEIDGRAPITSRSVDTYYFCRLSFLSLPISNISMYCILYMPNLSTDNSITFFIK